MQYKENDEGFWQYKENDEGLWQMTTRAAPAG